MVLYALSLSLLLIRRRFETGRTATSLLPAYAMMCLLGGMSNLLFFVHMLLPITAALLAACFFGLLEINRCYVPVVVGWPAAALGALLNKVLFHTSDLSAQSRISVDRMLLSLNVFLKGMIDKFAAGDTLHLIAITWAIACAAYIVYVLRLMTLGYRDQVGLPRALVWLFLMSCLLASACGMAAVIVGGSNGLAEFKDYVWTMHYLHPAFLLPVFGLVLMLAWGLALKCPPPVCRRIALFTALLALLAPAYKIASSRPPRREIYAYRPPLVQFLDDLARRENLRYGYAGYWQARLITLLSQRGLRAYAVDGVLNPLLWVSNREWYFESVEDRSRRPKIDFVVLDDPAWKISREGAVRALGEPAREVRFENTRILLYSRQMATAQSSR